MILCRIFIVFVVAALMLAAAGMQPAHAELGDELIAYYPLDGNADDESGNGYHGLVQGAELAADRNGIPDSAYLFDGAASIESPAFPGISGAFTVAAWVRYTDLLGKSEFRSIASHSLQAGESAGFVLGLKGSQYNLPSFEFTICDDNGGEFSVSAGALASNIWYHVTAVYTGERQEIYINGTLYGAANNSGNILLAQNSMYIGKHDLGGGFVGYLDEISFHGRALSPEEIGQLYDGTFSPSVTDYTGWWYTPNQPGTGLSLAVEYKTLFMVWYIFDDSGEPLWYAAWASRSESAKYEGELRRFTGWDPAGEWTGLDFTGEGLVSISFTDKSHAELAWEMDGGETGTRQIEKYMQSIASGSRDTRRLDGWWIDETLPGMGFFIETMGETMYLGWYHYTSGGEPLWRTLGGWVDPGGFPQGCTDYKGILQKYTGGWHIGGNYSSPTISDQGDLAEVTVYEDWEGAGDGPAMELDWLGNIFTLKRYHFSTPELPPAKPRNLKAVGANRQITVSWDQVPFAETYNLHWARASTINVPNKRIVGNVTSPYTHTNVVNDLTYTYQLFAVNEYGESQGSATTTTTPTLPDPPPPPSNVSAEPANESAIVDWDEVEGAESYNIYWLGAPGVTKEVGKLVADVTPPHTVTDLVNGTEYYFVVVSVNAGGEGEESAEVKTIPHDEPQPPSQIAAEAGDKMVTVTWNEVVDIDYYNIYWSKSSGLTVDSAEKVQNVTSPFLLKNLENDTTYYFFVTTVNSRGESAPSQKVSAKPQRAPLPPTGVTALARDESVILVWDDVEEANYYNIYWSTNLNFTTETGTKVTFAYSPSTISGLTNGTKYYFMITSVTDRGESEPSVKKSAIPTP